MSLEYRSAYPEEMRRLIYNDHIAFGQSTAEAEIERSLAWVSSFLRPEDILVAVEDGAIVSQMGVLPLTIRWNGRDIACGGVTAVSTLPSHRRRGHLRALMSRAFAAMREQGQPVAMLWASMAAIYQRFGYGVAFTQYIAEFDPRLVRFVDDVPVPGRMRLLPPEEVVPLVRGAYERFAAPRTLMLCRDEAWWRRRTLHPWRPNAPPPLCAVYEEAGEVLGFTIYEVEHRVPERPGPTQRLDATWVWLTPGAHRALVRYFLDHDLAASVRVHRLPVDDPLPLHVQEPRQLNLWARDGSMLRIVDLVPALEGRGYDADGRLTFALHDELCPWNSGAWELTVEGGTGRLHPTAGEPDVCLTPRVLAVLASGHQPASVLARAGLVAASDARALAAADALFRTAHAPLCLDGF
jgi:predicted acetyltransferase